MLEPTGGLFVMHFPGEVDEMDGSAVYWSATSGGVPLPYATRYTFAEAQQHPPVEGGVWLPEEDARQGAPFPREAEMRVTCTLTMVVPKGTEMVYRYSDGEPDHLRLPDGREVRFWVKPEMDEVEVSLDQLEQETGIAGCDYDGSTLTFLNVNGSPFGEEEV